ncbi:unnamed protein product [Schistosoma mattheei]|uniref:Uncharacterized protein n=1 Tax=Schistosoma mattheei TaxID=31246 RepID=A0A183P625_9TREM|nr:unnamed protein product [Schistosoma mattheei]
MVNVFDVLMKMMNNDDEILLFLYEIYLMVLLNLNSH